MNYATSIQVLLVFMLAAWPAQKTTKVIATHPSVKVKVYAPPSAHSAAAPRRQCGARCRSYL